MVLARQRQAAGKPRGAGAQKKKGGRGIAMMNEAAGETLEVFSKEIAMLLLEKTLGGNTTSAKLLFALAEGQIDCEDKVVMQRLYSYAEKLASEPKWNGVILEAEIEMGVEQGKARDCALVQPD
jgi:hypothetical protein